MEIYLRHQVVDIIQKIFSSRQKGVIGDLLLVGEKRTQLDLNLLIFRKKVEVCISVDLSKIMDRSGYYKF